MKSLIIVSLVSLVSLVLLTGCATPSNVGKSYNFSLVKVVMNVALYKSTVSSAEAGENISQKSAINAPGDESVSIPLMRSAYTGTTDDGINEVVNNKYNISAIPLMVNLGIWKSIASSSSGMLIEQEATVNAEGNSSAEIE